MLPGVKQKIEELPKSCGVYLMKSDQRVIYVGKAKDIRARWRSYISGTDDRFFVKRLQTELTDIEVVLTETEKEALLLESELIREYRPCYNVKLVDDKRYLCLRIDMKQRYPRLEFKRNFKKDGARYFGPYDSAGAIRRTLTIINRHFQLRTCSDQVLRSRTTPCLQYQIKRCPAPCVYDMEDTYRQHANNVIHFLQGRSTQLVENLRTEMKRSSLDLDYERAAQIRDQMYAVERSLEAQKVVHAYRLSRDMIGYYRQGSRVEIYISRTRGGRLTKPHRFSLEELELSDSDIVGGFLGSYYLRGEGGRDVPREIILPFKDDWQQSFEEALRQSSGKEVQIKVAQRGPLLKLSQLAQRNAKQGLKPQSTARESFLKAAHAIKKKARLNKVPIRIECVDVSHLQGAEIVASVVGFEEGVPNKPMYRRYKIRTREEQDDFQSIYEVMVRRARRGLEKMDLPDLIIIDGGKGQLNAAQAAFTDYGIDSAALIALAKARSAANSPHKIEPGVSSRHKEERVFIPDRKTRWF